jgi:hypothetical protein
MSFLLSLLLFHIQHSWNIVDNIVITLFAAIYFLNLFSYLFSSYYDYFEWNPLLLLDFLMILRWLLKHLHHFSYSLFVPVRSCLIAYDCCYFELHRRWYRFDSLSPSIDMMIVSPFYQSSSCPLLFTVSSIRLILSRFIGRSIMRIVSTAVCFRQRLRLHRSNHQIFL